VTIDSSPAIRGTKRSRFKRIVISQHNYLALKRLGYAGDSFNDVVSKLLRIEKIYQEMKKQQQEEQQQEGIDGNSSKLLSSLDGPSSMFEEHQHNKQQMDALIQLLRGKRRGRCSMNNQTSEQESNNTIES
jgi:predicted CopG family antitoxin